MSFDASVEVEVEGDGVAGVVEEVFVGADAVGDVGVGEGAAVEEGGEVVGGEVAGGFEELEEVDDLVVAPVADVAPGVVRFCDLPLEAVAGDAVGVEAVGGGGVEESGDEGVEVMGEGVGEGFPVLEDVAPVALVVEDGLAGWAGGADGEAVPGA